jgi:hypothetical protein
MIALQRITTEYVEAEDRISIVGELDAADTVVIWLTRRRTASESKSRIPSDLVAKGRKRCGGYAKTNLPNLLSSGMLSYMLSL